MSAPRCPHERWTQGGRTDLAPRTPSPATVASPVESSRRRAGSQHVRIVTPADRSAAQAWQVWTLTGALAALWATLAWLNPTTTYHLAPAVVAASSPVGIRARRGAPLPLRPTIAVVAIGLLVVATVLIVLEVSDALRGPSLVPWTGSLGESILVALVAAAYGFMVLLRHRPPWYLRETSSSAEQRPEGTSG